MEIDILAAVAAALGASLATLTRASVFSCRSLTKTSIDALVVLTVEFTVAGLNGGPEFKHNEAFSLQSRPTISKKTDRDWNAIVGNGWQERRCGGGNDKASPGR